MEVNNTESVDEQKKLTDEPKTSEGKNANEDPDAILFVSTEVINVIEELSDISDGELSTDLNDSDNDPLQT